MLRIVSSADAEAILDIYAPYIEKTSLTFETEIPSIEEFRNRINDYLKNWPWLVYEVDNKIVGYAYGSKYRERAGYQWCAECSVYVHDDFQKVGIAKALYTALFEILKCQGFRNLYAVINTPNDRSVSFHEKMGFKFFAMYENVGYKLGNWKNVGWWQLKLNDYSDEPDVPMSFQKLNKDFLPNLFLEMEKLIKVK